MSALVPCQKYSPDDFVIAALNDTSKMQPGTVLKIETEDLSKRVTFIFHSWCIKKLTRGYLRIDGLCGARPRGRGIFGTPFENESNKPLAPEDICLFSQPILLLPGEFRAKTITYISDNCVAYVLEGLPGHVTRLIWQYVFESTVERHDIGDNRPFPLEENLEPYEV